MITIKVRPERLLYALTAHLVTQAAILVHVRITAAFLFGTDNLLPS
jgi:hypothetical protein